MAAIGIIEPNFYLRTGFTGYLGSFSDLKVVFSVPSPSLQTQKLNIENTPDVIMLGLEETNQESVSAELHYLKIAFPKAYIILLTPCEDPLALGAFLKFGAQGHIVRTPRLKELTDAIDAVRTAGAYLCGRSAVVIRRYFFDNETQTSSLTRREAEILAHIRTGSSIKQIASILHISLPTVNFHLKNIYKKMKVSSRSELMATLAA